MFPTERTDKIKEILIQYKHVDVSTLSSVLSVSEATIRRDLEKLESESFLKRNYGGAILNESIAPDTSINAENIQNIEEKKHIGYIAAQLVDNNDVIFIGSGITCLQFAKNLKNKKNLTIVTNNIMIANELSDTKEVKVILTGGDLLKIEDSISMVGEFALNMLEEVFVDKAFLSVNGIDIDYGYTYIYSEIAQVSKVVVKIAKEIIILSDFTKFGKRSFVKLGQLSIANKIVTNEQVSEEFKLYYFENGIPIYTSYKLDTL